MKRPLLALALLGAAPSASAAPLPAPVMTMPEGAGLQTAVLAGGCFWGMEAVFEHVKGVRNVVSGFAGGSAADARYDRVSSERTGHAEAIRISYDPRQIGYGELLRIFFAVAHDPTQLNRQGPDEGPSYRSAIFPQTPAQRKIAEAYLTQLRAAKLFPRPAVTRIETGRFFPAEAYHQDFMRRNPNHPYILAHDLPKLRALKAAFPARYR